MLSRCRRLGLRDISSRRSTQVKLNPCSAGSPRYSGVFVTVFGLRRVHFWLTIQFTYKFVHPICPHGRISLRGLIP
jgi:hypothetical protein